MRGGRGVTLLELMVVVALIGVLAGLTWAGWQQVGRRTAAQNAAYELGSALSLARDRAVARGWDVWVIVYPEVTRGGEVGHGAYFVYDDPDLSFGGAGSGAPGELRYASFRPDNRHPSGGRGRLLEEAYLDAYPGKQVRFAAPPPPAAFRAPFATLNPLASACSFCTMGPGGLRGAIVFGSTGAARLVDGGGARLPARTGGLALHSPAPEQTFLFAVAAATGYSEVQSP